MPEKSEKPKKITYQPQKKSLALRIIIIAVAVLMGLGAILLPFMSLFSAQ